MSNLENMISEEELAIIEEVTISESIEKSIKVRSETFIYRELFNKALENVKATLDQGEVIDECIIGRDYKADSMRAVISSATTYVAPGTFAYIAHPVMDWSAKLVLIKTNKRLLVMETAQYFKYLKHYEIENSVKLYNEKLALYLEVFDLKGEQKIAEFKKEKINNLVEKLKENDINFIETKEKLKTGERKILNIAFIINTMIWTTIFIIFLYFFITKGTAMFDF